MQSPFECLCGNFILPEPASYVFFYAFSNLRNLLYIIYEYLSGEYDYQAIFANDENNWIVINRFDGTSTYNVDTEGAEIVEEIMINGNSGLRIVKNGQTHIALANTDKNIFIDICSSEHVPGEVVEKIAQNIFVID